jgi:hypothetical protein
MTSGGTVEGILPFHAFLPVPSGSNPIEDNSYTTEAGQGDVNPSELEECNP